MEHIRQAFNRFAQDYDSQREYIIPNIRQYYGAAVWAMESRAQQPEILDVGAGTGLLSAFLLEKFSDARLTLMDISENMLEMAKKRFADRPETRYVVSDYSTGELGGPYRYHLLGTVDPPPCSRGQAGALPANLYGAAARGDLRQCRPGGRGDPLLPAAVP